LNNILPLEIIFNGVLKDGFVESEDHNDGPELFSTNFGYRAVLSAPGIEKVSLAPVRNGYKVAGGLPNIWHELQS
jgi:hypothetical protein